MTTLYFVLFLVAIGYLVALLAGFGNKTRPLRWMPKAVTNRESPLV